MHEISCCLFTSQQQFFIHNNLSTWLYIVPRNAKLLIIDSFPHAHILYTSLSLSHTHTHTHTHTLGPSGSSGGGVVYTRWGKTTCSNTSGAELLYVGRAAGSWYSQSGGGANYLCLPEQPENSTYTAGSQDGRALLYGAEYQTTGNDNGPLRSFHDHNVPCAVCYTSTRETVVMIPARLTCPSSWTREYYGYLMASYHSHQRTMFECVDRSPESVPDSTANTDGALFYHTEVRCGYGIPCPPYDAEKEVVCAVCTK